MKGKKKVSLVYPELVVYFKNKEDADKYSIRSDARVVVKCPTCGHEHVMIVKNLTRRHYNCPVCGSKKSFPERLIMAILDSIGERYTYQLSNKDFSWCENYLYDFYLLDKNIIIETDGPQHKLSEFKFKGAKTIGETKKIDTIKEKLASNNGIKIIRIDFSDGDILKIKEEIKRKLKDIIDVDKIDWIKCVSTASGSTFLKVCDAWNKEKELKTTNDLAKDFKLSRDTILRMIHKGVKLGICEYDTVEEKKRASKIGGEVIKKNRTKPILVYDKNDNFVGEYSGAKQLSKISENIFGIKFDYEGIIYTCNGTQKTHKGYKFKYKNDYNK